MFHARKLVPLSSVYRDRTGKAGFRNIFIGVGDLKVRSQQWQKRMLQVRIFEELCGSPFQFLDLSHELLNGKIESRRHSSNHIRSSTGREKQMNRCVVVSATEFTRE